MTDIESILPVTLYGSNISYFTGKMENYFRVRDIPYRLHSMQYPADEWWWRPAMHYRWHYPEGARFASWHLATELMGSNPAPVWVKRRVVQRRQRRGYTSGDGITPDNIPAVEAGFKRLLRQLQAIFTDRPFILGGRPSLADIGFSGPFFRHFALDPVPLEIIRQEAPAVLEWVARLWNTRIDTCSVDWATRFPADLGPLLDDIGAAYLPYLCANVDAVSTGKKQFDVKVDGAVFRGARYSRYRVWCLQELRSHFLALPDGAQATARELLEKHACWEPLWRNEHLPLLPGQEQQLPFRGDTKMVGVNE